MNEIDNLLDAVNRYYHSYGEYPKVFVARGFWEDNADEIAKLHNDGIEVEVVDHTQFRSFYLKGTGNTEQHIDTVDDLYERVKKLKEEGKGAWPVRSMPPDANVYLPIQLHPVIPHNDEETGVERLASIWGDPNREFILVVIGDINGGEI